MQTVCRLYGFRANEPTKVECTLVYAQNALMLQSRADRIGKSHANGWGLATYEGEAPHVERQAWAAYHGEHFRRSAARIFACQVLAHVRRATVGPPSLANTHPFVDGQWTFIHNGTIPNFAKLRPWLLEALPHERREAIHGDTDSEHFFQYLRTVQELNPGLEPIECLRLAMLQVFDWCREIDPVARIGLNVILTDGMQMVGSRLGRDLCYVDRIGVHDCEICGFPHVHHDPHRLYRAIIVASEPVSHEHWHEIPERSLYRVGKEISIEIEPLGHA